MSMVGTEAREKAFELVLGELDELLGEVRSGQFDQEDLVEAFFDVVGSFVAFLIPGSFDDAFVVSVAEQMKEKALESVERTADELLQAAASKEERSAVLVGKAEEALATGDEAKAARLQKRAAKLAAKAAKLREQAVS